MILQLQVQPRAKRNRLVRQQEEWKLQLAAPPIEGKANQACIKFLAQGLGIARSRVRLLAGEKSRHKRIELEGVTEEEFLKFAGKETP
ncbi:MAG: hypothetical protein A3G20_03810 [Acidobacteria bacterium RIFCSPLOWO2_12_FULL_59_11]|nr:MAG: hypothetical protein A3G20_03810 [Acidobacteria bacterium RIFCSPLOWO2_12_FULL_59_11]